MACLLSYRMLLSIYLPAFRHHTWTAPDFYFAHRRAFRFMNIADAGEELMNVDDKTEDN